jgi:hypothetical protein
MNDMLSPSYERQIFHKVEVSLAANAIFQFAHSPLPGSGRVFSTGFLKITQYSCFMGPSAITASRYFLIQQSAFSKETLAWSQPTMFLRVGIQRRNPSMNCSMECGTCGILPS